MTKRWAGNGVHAVAAAMLLVLGVGCATVPET